jgi:hypothetical protein
MGYYAVSPSLRLNPNATAIDGTGARTWITRQSASYRLDDNYAQPLSGTQTITGDGITDCTVTLRSFALGDVEIIFQDAALGYGQYWTLSSAATGPATIEGPMNPEEYLMPGVKDGGYLDIMGYKYIDLTALLKNWNTVEVVLDVIPTSVNTTTSNWTITGPSAITVTGVSWTPGTSIVTLTTSGAFVPGTYTLSVAPGTVSDLMSVNQASRTFESHPVPIAFSVLRKSSSLLRVNLDRVPTVVSANSLDYVLTGPSSLSVDTVSYTPGNDYLELTVSGGWVSGTHTLSIASQAIQDGWTNAPSADFEYVADAIIVEPLYFNSTQTMRAYFTTIPTSVDTDPLKWNITGPYPVTPDTITWNPGDDYVEIWITVLTADGLLPYGTYTLVMDPGVVTDGSSVNILSAIFEVKHDVINYWGRITGVNTVRIDIGQEIPSAVSNNPLGYTIVGPSAITVNTVSWTPGNSYIDLTVTGTFAAGQYSLFITPGILTFASNSVSALYTYLGGATGGTGITLTSVTGGANTVNILFSSTPTLLQDALLPNRYIITGPNSEYVPVFSVNVSGNSIILSTGWQANGTTYSLRIPSSWIANGGGSVFTGPFTQNFTGVATSPALTIARTVDSRTIEVWFNKPVNELDALNTNNYSITNGLTVSGVSKVSDTIFTLTTSHQTVGTSYTVTASNIRDFQGLVI